MFKPALLAPAGSMEAFEAAICGGCDAIYLGGDRFGARAYADNFHTEELIRAISYAHLFGVKVYLTCNTLAKEEELEEVVSFIEPYANAGLDGVIIQDMGVFSVLKEHFPHLELHASTQMAITGREGAALLKKLGASRVVPARELSLSEIRSIKEHVDIELECFIHGAMCYSYSGSCLFSAALGDRSGNRGRCAGPCRLEYTSFEKEAYILSMRDMCTLQILPKLMDAKIDSFKIEGRMKKPEYVFGVTRIYRTYIDRYLADPDMAHYAVDPGDLDLLKHLYLRSDISTGYYEKLHGRDMLTIRKPGYNDTPDELLARLQKEQEEAQPRISVKGHVILCPGETSSFTVSARGMTVTVQGETVLEAQNRPLSREEIIKRMSKMGGTVFTPDEITVQTKGQVFLPVAALNNLRRLALETLEKELCQNSPLK